MSKYRKKPFTIEAITFDELVAHGRTCAESWGPTHLRMPWSFKYKGLPITHENDDCYLIPTPNGTAKLVRGDMLCSQVVNDIVDLWPVAGDIFAATYEAIDEVYERGFRAGRDRHDNYPDMMPGR